MNTVAEIQEVARCHWFMRQDEQKEDHCASSHRHGDAVQAGNSEPTRKH